MKTVSSVGREAQYQIPFAPMKEKARQLDKVKMLLNMSIHGTLLYTVPDTEAGNQLIFKHVLALTKKFVATFRIGPQCRREVNLYYTSDKTTTE